MQTTNTLDREKLHLLMQLPESMLVLDRIKKSGAQIEDSQGNKRINVDSNRSERAAE
jgi:hypothetical protein